MDSMIASEKPADDSITISPSTALHFSVIRTSGNHTSPMTSPAWHSLQAEILDRDNRTCAFCGYTSPDPNGKGLRIDHRDGDPSNNDPANLRAICSPCYAVRHCGRSAMKRWIILAKSNMDQVEIIRKTRMLFEQTGKIPNIREVDLSAVRVNMNTSYLANKLLEIDWEDLPEDLKGYKGFFTIHSADDLFALTMAIEPTQLRRQEASDAAALDLEKKHNLLWVTFPSEQHPSLRSFLAAWHPATTSRCEVEWICVRNQCQQVADNVDAADEQGLDQAWNDLCTSRQPTADDLDELARRYDVLTGKWMIFSPSNEIDALWSRIATATHAGTLGLFAKVSPLDDSNSHAICIHTRDYTNKYDVDKVRNGLRRIGVRWRIKYKPDIYTHCGVYKGNAWHIMPTLYYS